MLTLCLTLTLALAGTSQGSGPAPKPAPKAAAPRPKPATNAICPVLGGKTDAKSAVVAVRGREYRLCCPGCGPKLQADPDRYLEKDGTPRNAKAGGSGHDGHGAEKH